MADGKQKQSAIRLSRFALRLWQEWKRLDLPCEDARVVVGVSGGADSVALFLALNELVQKEKLTIDLIMAHFNHGLRREAEEDAAWVKNLITNYELRITNPKSKIQNLKSKIVLGKGDVFKQAEQNKDNLEQAARRARYDFLFDVAAEKNASIVLTAHTMDDQAETVLLRLMRGSGTDGLGGIKPIQHFKIQNSKFNNASYKEQETKDEGQRTKDEGQETNPKSKIQNLKSRVVLLVRPLLQWARREDTANFCRECGVDFLSDAMNEDLKFARVRVRKELLPLLRRFNNRIVESLVRTAEILREDDEELNTQAAKLLVEATSNEEKNESSLPAPLRVKVLLDASVSLRRRALRLWFEEGRNNLRRIDMIHILQVESLLKGEQGGRIIVLPGGCMVERRKQKIFFKHGKDDKKPR